MDVYSFTADAGDMVLFRWSDDGAFMTTDFRLYTSVGELLKEMKVDSFGEFTQTFEAAGTYAIMIGDDNGTETGNYSIYLERMNPPITSPRKKR